MLSHSSHDFVGHNVLVTIGISFVLFGSVSFLHTLWIWLSYQVIMTTEYTLAWWYLETWRYQSFSSLFNWFNIVTVTATEVFFVIIYATHFFSFLFGIDMLWQSILFLTCDYLFLQLGIRITISVEKEPLGTGGRHHFYV